MPAAPRKPRWAETLIVALLALAALALLASRSDLLVRGHPDFAKPWDHHKYIHMAEGGAFEFGVAPFCWRVGLPLAAAALPLSTRDAFFALTLLSLFAAGLLLHRSARLLGHSAPLAAAGMLLFYSLGWAAKYNLIHFWLSDAAAFAFVGGVILLTLEGRPGWAALLLALGVTVKESVILAAPLLYTLRAGRPWDRRLLVRSALAALPAAAVLLLLRLAIHMQNADPAYLDTLPERLSTVHRGTPTYSLRYLWSEFGMSRLFGAGLRDLKEMSIWSWGPLVLLFPFFLVRGARTLFLRLAPLLLLAYGQLFMASNSQRLLMLAAPAVILPGLAVLRLWGRWLRAGEGIWLALAAGLFFLKLLNPEAPSVAFSVQLAYFLAFLLALLIARPFRLLDRAGQNR